MPALPLLTTIFAMVGVGPIAERGVVRAPDGGLVAIAGKVVVPAVAHGEGRRGVGIQDVGLSRLAREVDEDVGPLRRSQQQVKGAVGIGRIGINSWTRCGITMYRQPGVEDRIKFVPGNIDHSGQETALGAYLKHGRAGVTNQRLSGVAGSSRYRFRCQKRAWEPFRARNRKVLSVTLITG